MFGPSGIFNWRQCNSSGIFNCPTIKFGAIFGMHLFILSLIHTFRHLITLLRQGLRQQITPIYADTKYDLWSKKVMLEHQLVHDPYYPY